MARGRFKVKADNSRFRRGYYDLVLLNPWWIDRAPLGAVTGVPFPLFCEEIRDKAHGHDPAFCLVGIEMYLMRHEKLTQARSRLIRQDYRKLLFSGRLPKLVSKGKEWRFTDHRYMLVYSHHVQPDDEQCAQLCCPLDEDVDTANIWMVWTSARGTRWSD